MNHRARVEERRGKSLENYAGDLPTSGSGGVSAAPSDRLILLRRCLEAVKSDFEPRTYQAFWAVVMEGKPPKEVARVLAMKSVGAVHTAKSRVMKRLHELLEELGPGISGI